MHCLLIEDDPAMAASIAGRLRDLGHRLTVCEDAPSGLALATAQSWDVVIVDRMLPAQADGLDIVSAMRAARLSSPTLVLSALGQLDQRVQGLRAGADDYLAKPFAFDELLARIEALARRSSLHRQQLQVRAGPLLIDLQRRHVSRHGQTVHLQPKEYQLLDYLARRRGELISRDVLLAEVWGYHFDPGTKVIDVQISRLRRKIDDTGEMPLIRTIRGAGYMFADTDSNLG